MPFKDPVKRREYEKTSPKRKANRKRYYKKHKAELIKKSTQWKKDNPDKTKIQNQKSYQKHREKRIKEMNDYRKLNKEKIADHEKIRNKKRRKHLNDNKTKWRKKYPKKALKAEIRYLEKNGMLYNMSAYQFKMALESWSDIINKRDKSCVICGSKNKVQSHHIFYKQYFPQLTLNENNGVLLCVKHHNEIHHS